MTESVRREFIKLLPCDVPSKQLKFIYKRYGNNCLLTGEIEDVTIEHFIPIQWGHGGNLWGNLYPISRSLNVSKKDANPFEWVKLSQISRKIKWDSWNRLIKLVAMDSGLTPSELVEYTYWCENNKYSIEELKIRNNLISLEFWKKLKSRPGYESYAPDGEFLYNFRRRQELLKEEDQSWSFRAECRKKFIKEHFPIVDICKHHHKIKYIDKGKYSSKFKKINYTARFLCTSKNGIDIDEWASLFGYTVPEILEFLVSFDRNKYYY